MYIFKLLYLGNNIHIIKYENCVFILKKECLILKNFHHKNNIIIILFIVNTVVMYYYLIN